MKNIIQTRVRAGLVLASLFWAGAGAQAQNPSIPSTHSLPASAADTSKPGFIWRVHQTVGGQPNALSRLEAQLAGDLGANVADPAAVGVALAPAAPPNPANAPIQFEIPAVINLDQTGGSNGNFTPDEQMPGIPGTGGSTDNIAAEALTWLDLPAGEIVMGVNSDDGFEVRIGGAAPSDRLFSTRVGAFDGGRGAADTIFRFNISQAGLYATRLTWMEGGGGANVEWFTIKSDGTRVLVNDTANGGVRAFRAVTQRGSASATKVLPAPGSTGVAPNERIVVELVDGAAAVAAASVTMKLDDQSVTPTVSKTGDKTTISFTPAALFAPASTHTVTLSYTDGTRAMTANWSFTVQNYGTLRASAKVTPDTSKPGFLWRVHQVSIGQPNSLSRLEAQLAGELKDADGNPLPNIADPAAVGVALAAAAAPNPASAPIQFEIAGSLNLSQTAGENNGGFGNDEQMPGIPGLEAGTDNIAAEVLTYIELPAGIVRMGVNSDDGFRTSGGNIRDSFEGVTLGEFDGGRGAADTVFSIRVEEAGVYPFRTIWMEGGGGANIEWFTFKADGTKVLVNDVANGGLKAYRAATSPLTPAIAGVTPAPTPRQVNVVSPVVKMNLLDGTADRIDDASVKLTINGAAVTPTLTRSGSRIALVYTPAGLQIPGDVHSASLTFTAGGGRVTRTQDWTFRNLKNLVLPNPVAVENFDSYPEGAPPPGWTAVNFTTTCTEGEDVLNQASDTYKNWVVISTDTVQVVDGARALNVAPGQTLNGRVVSAEGPVFLMEGNVLYAESDGRCADQVQFITSKKFDLSSVRGDVALSFSSIYEQNQDSIGSVEYSVDGGNTWAAALIYLDTPDIKLNPDGTVNPFATMFDPNPDTAAWVDNGVAKGDRYGDALLAPINAALANVIAPRINDNSTEGKRIEVVRLPGAAGKSDVRLRFAQLGTDSWYFGIDNIAFYDVPALVTAPAAPTITTQPANQTVPAGSSASFTVAATGVAPLTYQWRKDGVAIAGATSATYTKSSVQASDAGVYTVEIRGGNGGSVVSAGATLTVSSAPPPGGMVYFSENFDSVDTAGLIAKGWKLDKNESAREVGTEFVVAPPYALATPDNAAEPSGDLTDPATGKRLLNPPMANGHESSGKYLISDSDRASGSDDVGSGSEFWAITASFSTLGSTEAWFHADTEIENNNNGECIVELAASIDGGTTWIPMWQTAEPQRPLQSLNRVGDVNHGATRIGGYPELGSASATKSWGGIHGRWHVKLPAQANNRPDVRLRIMYHEPGDAWWIALDNIVVDSNPPPRGQNVALLEQFEQGIPSTWRRTNKLGQNWGTEPLKDSSGTFLRQGGGVPINIDLLREAASRNIAKANILNPDLNTEFAQINPNGVTDGRWILMLAGGNYALWQEGDNPDEESTLETPALNMSQASGVFLDFDSESLPYNSGVRHEVHVSTDGGQSWSQIFTYMGALLDFGEAPYFDHHYLEVPSAAGKSDVRFRFYAKGADPGNYRGFWAIDNVRVTSNPVSAPADIRIASATISGANIVLNWTGGTGPFLVQGKASLSDAAWTDIVTTTDRSVSIPMVGTAGFLRVQGGTTKNIRLMKAVLSGAAENPATDSPGRGAGWVAVDGTTVTYYVSYSGLKAAATAAHVHGPAEATANAGVMFGMTGSLGTSGGFAGTATVTAAQAADILAGKAYFNIHTSAHPGGEIRGQLVP